GRRKKHSALKAAFSISLAQRLGLVCTPEGVIFSLVSQTLLLSPLQLLLCRLDPFHGSLPSVCTLRPTVFGEVPGLVDLPVAELWNRIVCAVINSVAPCCKVVAIQHMDEVLAQLITPWYTWLNRISIVPDLSKDLP
ncbi:unnamed protein product, partial [Heterosigma akashiwo]